MKSEQQPFEEPGIRGIEAEIAPMVYGFYDLNDGDPEDIEDYPEVL